MLRAPTSVYPKAKPGFHLEKQKEDSHLFTAVNVILCSISASLLHMMYLFVLNVLLCT